jgi:adenylate cyclase
MAIEIERKFLLRTDAWRGHIHRSITMAQGYLGGEHCSVRVRIGDNGAFLNIKSKQLGVQRLEFEYAIPENDAQIMLAQLCNGASVIKTRHLVMHQGLCFEIDEFSGSNAGLIVAELELQSVDQIFERPDWLGSEVTDDARYYNSNLIRHPFKQWAAN